MAQTMDKGQMKRRPVDPMRHHRENGWDYRGRAIYHFTLPVEERFPLFGTLEGERAETAFVRLFRLHRRTEVAGLSFTSMGNHFLLEWPDRQVVEMSRSATNEEVQEQLRKVLAAAHNGTVTYTAAISKGEQLIARTLREQGYPLVVLLNDGFPKEGSPHERYYKPGGVYFEACSKGQLLLLEPTEQTFFDAGIQTAVEETLCRKAEERHYAYTPIPVTSHRYHFVALNEMAKRLAQNLD